MRLSVQTPDELIAAVPHVLGFRPVQSLVLVPFTKGLPTARIDLPTIPQDCDAVLERLKGPYARHARPGSRIAVVCFTNDRGSAGLASHHVAAGLTKVGVATAVRLWTDDQRWADLDTGHVGMHAQQAADRIAATTVLAGVAMPVQSRTSLAASLRGDPEGVAQALPAARHAAEASAAGGEVAWALRRLEQFHVDGVSFSDSEAARLLMATSSTTTRDVLWANMTRENARSHVALWSDLTRRAPDEVRAAPAALLAFSSWLRGDGARAWCAIDRVPEGRNYPMAGMVATALQSGLHPAEWDRVQSATLEATVDVVDESYVPDRAAERASSRERTTGGRDAPSAGSIPPDSAPGR